MIADHELVLRVEDAISAERRAFADGMASLHPDSGACWIPIAGGHAIFTGAKLFTNRVMAAGLQRPVSESEVESAEAFYAQRGLPSEFELASVVDRSLISALGDRGYRLHRFRNIYVRTVGGDEPVDDTPAQVVEVDQATRTVWSTTLLDGFGYTAGSDRDRVEKWNRMLLSLGRLTAVVAVLDGRPVGAASVLLIGSTAVLGGATTLPAHRRRGIQQQLIQTRVAIASRAGCNLAVVTADPGSSSGRNAERKGFQLLCNHVSLRSSTDSAARARPRS